MGRVGRAGLLAALVFAWSAQGAVRAAPPPDSFADLAAELLPKVVNISATQMVEGRQGRQGMEMPQLPPGSPFEDFFKEFFDRNQQPGRTRRATSLGSGFFVSADGYVVTNNHVIQDADEIAVVLHDGSRLAAEVVGRDAKTDLAVLKVTSEKPLGYVKFGDSDKMRVGDWAIAIGNPFGLGGTVTAGIISARGRDIDAGPYDDFIQTDASINRGNSGGPLFNLAGEVIGVNTAIFSPTGGSVGIGFSIPASTVKPVVRQLMETGEVKRGWLGVHIQNVNGEIAETLGLEKAEGALIASVLEDGPAAKAGVKAGDVILEFAGVRITEMRRLPRTVAGTPAGEKVEVLIWRDRREKTLRVSVGELTEKVEQAALSQRSGGVLEVGDLGLKLSALNPRVRDSLDLADDAEGVAVLEASEDGTAAEKGVRPGDLILEVSQKKVSTPAEVAALVTAAKDAGRRSVLLLVEGRGGSRFIAVRIGEE
ncbi:MAG: DegQ family serine endoprotease [Rhodospirillales bacterium]